MYADSAATPFLAIGVASLLLLTATEPISPNAPPVGLAALGIGFVILICRPQQPAVRPEQPAVKPALSVELRVSAVVMCGILYAVLFLTWLKR